jgi:hypothetical protein
MRYRGALIFTWSGLVLAGVFASSFIPDVFAATTAEMIQAALPSTMTLRSAPRKDLLSAVCNAVSRNRSSAPQIVRLAIETRPELSSDVVSTTVGGLREPKEGVFDCELARRILTEATAANPSAASEITDLTISLLPDCQLDIPGEGPAGPTNLTPLLPLFGLGPSGCVVCHNGQEIHVLCDGVDTYLTGHPGDSRGACQSTPVTNR